MLQQPSKDPLHGMTLEAILKQLVYHYDWKELGLCINVRCFNFNPSSLLKYPSETFEYYTGWTV